MMLSFEAEPRTRKPEQFEAWLDEIGLLADCEGLEALIGILQWFSPVECCAYLITLPGVWPELLARARFADAKRFAEGVYIGRHSSR